MKTPSLNEFKAFSRKNAGLAMAVIAAQAFAAAERARVDAYIVPIFESFKFEFMGELASQAGLSGPIASKNDLYITEDEEKVAAYYAACDVAHRANGFDGPDGFCPALCAENDLVKAENALIDAGCELLGLDSSALIYGETRAKMLELLLEACALARKAA